MRMPSPAMWVKVHTVLCGLWVCLMIPSLLWWKDSLLWVIAMSCYANFAGSVASRQAAVADRDSPTVEHLERLERKVDGLRERIARR